MGNESISIMNDIIECVPSKDLRRHLIDHPIKLTVLQQATIVSEYAAKKHKVELLKQLAEKAETDSALTLLNTAIAEIKKTGYTGEASNRIYALLFPHNGFPLYPFLEVCDLPVLFKQGELIRFRKHHYYVAGTPVSTEYSDFTDECYYCYDLSVRIQNGEDLFSAHEHIHVCEAEAASAEDLNASEQKTFANVKRLLKTPSV